MLTKRRQLICLVFLIGLSALLDLVVANRMSVTGDEPTHLRYGTLILHSRPDRQDHGLDSQQPISALNAAPGVVASYLERRHLFPHFTADLSGLLAARFPTILATLALNLLIYLWALDLYGTEAAFAACLLCIFSPNLIAHGTLATTDTYHALGVVGSLYFFRRFLLQPTPTQAFLSGLALALAQITKPVALFVYGVVCLVIALAVFKHSALRSLTPRRLLVFAAIAASAFVATINFAYSFDRTFTRVGSYRFESTFFKRFQQTPFLRQVPVPLPYPFLQGLDRTKHNVDIGQSFGNVYLLGELRNSQDETFHGFKSYYAVAVFFKEPIALQILFLCGLVWIWKNRSFVDFLFGEGLLLAYATILMFWLSFLDRAQIGIRHTLPVLAIEIVIAAAAFSHFSSKPRAKKLLLSILVLWLVVSVASYYPHMIPYMNEWVHDRRLSYRILADSNLDWGQDEAVVEEFMRKNPDVILNPSVPVAGRILVNANRLTGVDRWNPPETSLAQRYRPVAQVGYAHFLFVVPANDIPPKDAENVQ
jgi:4-amino-4-deoxy-L-arabinose transferase-like glycosyltransferase